MLPLPPTQNTRPSGMSNAGPISFKLSRIMSEGVDPAVTQLPAAATYFSVCGELKHSTVKTVSSGSNVQVSSDAVEAFPPVAVQVFVAGV